MNWKEIQNGFGLTPVPRELKNEFVCTWCMQPARVLYTNQRINYGTNKELRKVMDDIRRNCWCKTHAIQMFDEPEE